MGKENLFFLPYVYLYIVMSSINHLQYKNLAVYRLYPMIIREVAHVIKRPFCLQGFRVAFLLVPVLLVPNQQGWDAKWKLSMTMHLAYMFVHVWHRIVCSVGTFQQNWV